MTVDRNFGVAAALAAPLTMTIGFMVWENHWHGSAFGLNLFKCNLASLGFIIVSTATAAARRDNDSEPLFSSDVYTLQAVGFLILSSTIGILIGDWAWLQGQQLLGSRRVILMDSLKPFLAALLGWWILDEALAPAAFGGMALTVTGVLVVAWETADDEETVPEEKEDAANVNDNSGFTAGVEESGNLSSREPTDVSDPEVLDSEQDADSASSVHDTGASPAPSTPPKLRTRKQMRVGYLMSIANVGLDVYGSVLTKQYGADMSVWDINLIRFGFAGLVMLILSLSLHVHDWFRRRIKAPETEGKEDGPTSTPWYALPLHEMTRKSWLHVSLGVLLVTFLTPSLSNYALFQIAIALALTLGSVGPLYSLPLAYWLQDYRPTMRACIGAVLAVAGIAVLSFKGRTID